MHMYPGPEMACVELPATSQGTCNNVLGPGPPPPQPSHQPSPATPSLITRTTPFPPVPRTPVSIFSCPSPSTPFLYISCPLAFTLVFLSFLPSSSSSHSTKKPLLPRQCFQPGPAEFRETPLVSRVNRFHSPNKHPSRSRRRASTHFQHVVLIRSR